MAKDEAVSVTDPERSEYGEALRGRDEARRRLIGLQKEMLAAKAQRAMPRCVSTKAATTSRAMTTTLG